MTHTGKITSARVNERIDKYEISYPSAQRMVITDAHPAPAGKTSKPVYLLPAACFVIMGFLYQDTNPYAVVTGLGIAAAIIGFSVWENSRRIAPSHTKWVFTPTQLRITEKNGTSVLIQKANVRSVFVHELTEVTQINNFENEDYYHSVVFKMAPPKKKPFEKTVLRVTRHAQTQYHGGDEAGRQLSLNQAMTIATRISEFWEIPLRVHNLVGAFVDGNW